MWWSMLVWGSVLGCEGERQTNVVRLEYQHLPLLSKETLPPVEELVPKLVDRSVAGRDRCAIVYALGGAGQASALPWLVYARRTDPVACVGGAASGAIWQICQTLPRPRPVECAMDHLPMAQRYVLLPDVDDIWLDPSRAEDGCEYVDLLVGLPSELTPRYLPCLAVAARLGEGTCMAEAAPRAIGRICERVWGWTGGPFPHDGVPLECLIAKHTTAEGAMAELRGAPVAAPSDAAAAPDRTGL